MWTTFWTAAIRVTRHYARSVLRSHTASIVNDLSVQAVGYQSVTLVVKEYVGNVLGNVNGAIEAGVPVVQPFMNAKVKTVTKSTAEIVAMTIIITWKIASPAVMSFASIVD